jgi:hypothetical protein
MLPELVLCASKLSQPQEVISEVGIRLAPSWHIATKQTRAHQCANVHSPTQARPYYPADVIHLTSHHVNVLEGLSRPHFQEVQRDHDAKLHPSAMATPQTFKANSASAHAHKNTIPSQDISPEPALHPIAQTMATYPHIPGRAPLYAPEQTYSGLEHTMDHRTAQMTSILLQALLPQSSTTKNLSPATSVSGVTSALAASRAMKRSRPHDPSDYEWSMEDCSSRKKQQGQGISAPLENHSF